MLPVALDCLKDMDIEHLSQQLMNELVRVDRRSRVGDEEVRLLKQQVEDFQQTSKIAHSLNFLVISIVAFL